MCRRFEGLLRHTFILFYFPSEERLAGEGDMDLETFEAGRAERKGKKRRVWPCSSDGAGAICP